MRLIAIIIAALVAATTAIHGQRTTPRRADGASRPEPGISEPLATERAARIRDLRYELTFDIPETQNAPIQARATLRFTLDDSAQPLVLDFAPAATNTSAVHADGAAARWSAVNGHIVIAPESLRQNANEIAIDFTAGDASLNRNPNYLYTLFVPSRAHLAFPCFDQPSLKARYTLALTVPAAWQAVANGAEVQRETTGDRATLRFAETGPLPTYLFAFAAGKFSVETAERSGRTFRMFHRETDGAKVARNREAIFDLHAKALTWLEDYTNIPYPWGKFDFVLIPSFQFSGMEHAGAILYNAASLLLEESATVNQQLGRASVISHETSHMWFGDLVTMRWFNDVWMKEVFANLMAAKIVNPSFPEVNHDLRFLLSYYPAAYDVDRTDGANAIRQPLPNLNEAGSLYGAIIYQKAPIVMRNLETLVGPDSFRDGLREYLRTYSFANATWADLIALLDTRTDENLQAWSRTWVEEAGRPTVRTELTLVGDRIGSLTFVQADPRRRGLLWNQRLLVTIGYPDGERRLPVHLAATRAAAADAVGLPRPLYVLPNGSGIAYGQIELDAASRTYLVQHLPEIANPLTRGSAWVTLWDELLRGVVSPGAFIELALAALPLESDELNVQQVLGYTRDAYWQFTSPVDRATLAPRVEMALRQGIDRAASQSLKSAYFRAFRDTALTPQGVGWLERVWRGDETIAGLSFAEVDFIAMALELAVREVPDWKDVLERQLGRTENPDRKARFAFVMPALDRNPAVRDRFFTSLSDRVNRTHEPWVIEGLRYIHHPLRAASAERYVKPSLEMLREIQRTGDIFFPKNWMDATLWGHASPAVARTVRGFLASLPPGYPPRLRMTIAASADTLFRAADIQSRAAGAGASGR
jgi:aminopeptidase N